MYLGRICNSFLSFFFFFIKDESLTTTALVFQIGLNNTQGPEKYTWKWSNGAPFFNNLSIKFEFNNYDGNVKNCPTGHCCVFHVKESTVDAFDNCCVQAASRHICSKDTN
jgi:hypothetical protein